MGWEMDGGRALGVGEINREAPSKGREESKAKLGSAAERDGQGTELSMEEAEGAVNHLPKVAQII